MPRSYAPHFRAMVIEHVRSGRPVAEVATSLELPESSVFRWVRQDKIGRGELVGTSTAESAEVRAAKRRIAELEAELATVKRATELFEKGRVVRPKDLFAIVEILASEGHGTKRGLPTPADRSFRVLPMAVDAAQQQGRPPSLAGRRHHRDPPSLPEGPTGGGASEPSWPTHTARRSTRS